MSLQQYLPFTVLKLIQYHHPHIHHRSCNSTYRLRYWNWRPKNTSEISSLLQQYLPFTVLKLNNPFALSNTLRLVATVLTVYGIETFNARSISISVSCCNSTYRLRYWNNNSGFNNQLFQLQQYLPFTVLKPLTKVFFIIISSLIVLQQYLPFTVLKLSLARSLVTIFFSCNSTYRLRYWNMLDITTLSNKQ